MFLSIHSGYLNLETLPLWRVDLIDSLALRMSFYNLCPIRIQYLIWDVLDCLIYILRSYSFVALLSLEHVCRPTEKVGRTSTSTISRFRMTRMTSPVTLNHWQGIVGISRVFQFCCLYPVGFVGKISLSVESGASRSMYQCSRCLSTGHFKNSISFFVPHSSIKRSDNMR